MAPITDSYSDPEQKDPEQKDPDVLADYARATAALIGLPIDDSWWPAVVRHLGVLLDRAASLEAMDGVGGVVLPDDPAPVFQA